MNRITPYISRLSAAILAATLLMGGSDIQGPGEIIAPDEWRALAAGRTLTYTVNGEFFALEQYSMTGDRVAIQIADGTCMSGRWVFQNDAYCFFWASRDPVCFRHERLGGEILVKQVIDGALIGSVQTMSQVSDAPLQCGALTS